MRILTEQYLVRRKLFTSLLLSSVANYIPLNVSGSLCIPLTKVFASKSSLGTRRNEVILNCPDKSVQVPVLHINRNFVCLNSTCIAGEQSLQSSKSSVEDFTAGASVLGVSPALVTWPNQSWLHLSGVLPKQVSVCGFFILVVNSSNFALMDDLVLIKEPESFKVPSCIQKTLSKFISVAFLFVESYFFIFNLKLCNHVPSRPNSKEHGYKEGCYQRHCQPLHCKNHAVLSLYSLISSLCYLLPWPIQNTYQNSDCNVMN